MPELALLRLVVFDSDHVFIGQRILPVNQMRAGFRHVSLRDKHNNPLGIANLFLHIKIEDYVPNEFEGQPHKLCIVLKSSIFIRVCNRS